MAFFSLFDSNSEIWSHSRVCLSPHLLVAITERHGEGGLLMARRKGNAVAATGSRESDAL